jgi:hypothetical protein
MPHLSHHNKPNWNLLKYTLCYAITQAKAAVSSSSKAIQLPPVSVNGLTFAVGCGAAGYLSALLLLDTAAQRAGLPDASLLHCATLLSPCCIMLCV